MQDNVTNMVSDIGGVFVEVILYAGLSVLGIGIAVIAGVTIACGIIGKVLQEKKSNSIKELE